MIGIPAYWLGNSKSLRSKQIKADSTPISFAIVAGEVNGTAKTKVDSPIILYKLDSGAARLTAPKLLNCLTFLM